MARQFRRRFFWPNFVHQIDRYVVSNHKTRTTVEPPCIHQARYGSGLAGSYITLILPPIWAYTALLVDQIPKTVVIIAVRQNGTYPVEPKDCGASQPPERVSCSSRALSVCPNRMVKDGMAISTSPRQHQYILWRARQPTWNNCSALPLPLRSGFNRPHQCCGVLCGSSISTRCVGIVPLW